MENKDQSFPIFITGSVRTGTSIVNRALMKGAKLPGYLEGCFINMLGDFLIAIDENYDRRTIQCIDPRIMISRFKRKELKNDLLKWFRDQYEAKSGLSGTWVDKTADAGLLKSMPYVLKMWPNAKFIVMKRRSIENVNSRIKKFPYRDFKNHCTGWAQTNKLWLESKKQLPPSTYIEIDQYDIATKPEEIASRLSDFLSLDKKIEENILNIFKKDRPEYTGGNEGKVKSLEETNWTEEEKEIFLSICGDMTKRCGWGLGNQYYEK